MLTNIFYYNYYRPYILKQTTLTKNNNHPTEKYNNKTNSNSNTEDFTLALNKSLKSDIVNYAKGIYSSVINLKHASKNVVNDINEFNSYSNHPEFDDDIFNSNLKEDLQEFVTQYNESSVFSENQQHSSRLSSLSLGLYDLSDSNKNHLAILGVEEQEDGSLFFNPEALSEAVENKAILSETINSSARFFHNVHQESKKVLSMPMANHMNFKGLTYYYNYKYDKVDTNSFQLIESGMLLDIVL